MKQYLETFRLFVAGIFLIFACGDSISAQHKISVAGIVVNSNGKPVEGANVSLSHCSAKCNGCHDEVFVVYKTGSNGVFFLDGIFPSRTAMLNIVTPASDGFWNLYPGDSVNKYPEFRGIPVNRPKSGATVNLGYVLANIVYIPFSIDLLKLFEVDKLGFDKLSRFKIGIQYKEVTIWDQIMITEKFIDWDNALAKLALPVGQWRLDFFATDNRQNKRLLKRTIVVRLKHDSVDIKFLGPVE